MIPVLFPSTHEFRFAGSDATTIAMRAVFYFLLCDNESYRRVQKEIDDATAAGSLSNPTQYSESLDLPFLCACIKEAMRLHLSVGLTMPRTVPVGGTTLCDRYLAQGYRVGMNAAVVHYDKSVFGVDADQFNPQRWLTGDAKKMDKYLLYFGAGTRTCIGKNVK
jgi:cytochrome P450